MTSDKPDPIKAEAARYKRATDDAKKSRTNLSALVLAALREPEAEPVDIAARAGWTPAYVRKLARENGIEADPAYKARTEKAKARLLAQAVAEQAKSEPPERPSPPADLGVNPRVTELSEPRLGQLAKWLREKKPDWYAEATADVDADWAAHVAVTKAVPAGHLRDIDLAG